MNSGTIISRCSTEKLHEVIKNMNNEQKTAIKKFGFGSLLGMDKVVVKGPLITYLVEHINPATAKMEISGKTYPINKEAFEHVMGIADGGDDIREGKDTEDEDEVKKKFDKLVEKQDGKITVKWLCDVLKESKEADDNYVIRFCLLAVGCLLCPTDAKYVKNSFLSALSNAERVKDKNWASFAVDYLLRSIDKLKKKTTKSKYLAGCTIFLQLYYFNQVIWGEGNKLNELPLHFWSVERVKRISNWLSRKGGYDSHKVSMLPAIKHETKEVQMLKDKLRKMKRKVEALQSAKEKIIKKGYSINNQNVGEINGVRCEKDGNQTMEQSGPSHSHHSYNSQHPTDEKLLLDSKYDHALREFILNKSLNILCSFGKFEVTKSSLSSMYWCSRGVDPTIMSCYAHMLTLEEREKDEGTTYWYMPAIVWWLGDMTISRLARLEEWEDMFFGKEFGKCEHILVPLSVPIEIVVEGFLIYWFLADIDVKKKKVMIWDSHYSPASESERFKVTLRMLFALGSLLRPTFGVDLGLYFFTMDYLESVPKPKPKPYCKWHSPIYVMELMKCFRLRQQDNMPHEIDLKKAKDDIVLQLVRHPKNKVRHEVSKDFKKWLELKESSEAE